MNLYIGIYFYTCIHICVIQYAYIVVLPEFFQEFQENCLHA